MDTINIGKRIKEARKKAGLTQNELAAKMGVSGSAIAQFERDEYNPTFQKITEISKALNCNISDLITDQEYSKQDKQDAIDQIIFGGTDNRIEFKIHQIIERMQMLNYAGQDKAIDLVDMLTKIPEYRI